MSKGYPGDKERRSMEMDIAYRRLVSHLDSLELDREQFRRLSKAIDELRVIANAEKSYSGRIIDVFEDIGSSGKVVFEGSKGRFLVEIDTVPVDARWLRSHIGSVIEVKTTLRVLEEA